ncbi:hypothetical protein HELRODRAFT_177831 [Helobdella robusta]|uniref:Uncharacterized protein n=1 Tax=Helobdella robusta TaxID=6412 RepID=T1FCC3_HELRO|nr:hypothetical protein HELRODRAFT_177831 [Helobdella robusta]ESN97768.1 hypothetical protein HELRODRAFT_177831 [Helobdella robusta]
MGEIQIVFQASLHLVGLFGSTAEASWDASLKASHAVDATLAFGWEQQFWFRLTEYLKKYYREGNLPQIIRWGQLKFLSHIMQKKRMENLTTNGKIAGKRDRSQQRITFVKSLCRLLNITTFQLLHSVKDRVLWMSMVANVLKE